MDEDYRVELDVYNGPLDLLLYLIRRDEIDIHDIPIARITEQYVQYVELITQFDPNMAGDFLVLAATLIAIKTRMLLPPGTEGDGDEDDEFGIDPRSELVRQLLEYKRFKDAAGDLLAAAQLQTMQHARNAPTLKLETDDLDIEDAQVWDLMDAFSKVLTAIGQNAAFHEVIYDDTPIELYEVDIVDRLQRDGAMTFEKVFEGCLNRGQLVGLFMALLELVRLQKVLTRQEHNFGTITIELNPKPPTEEQLAAMAQPASDEAAEQHAPDDAVIPGDSDEHRDTSD
ncbi:hypothetical protein LCGC14_0094200 [marine sediment metagenome]|uniref:Segregation and condensation protein A n=1 Tax=marine sediment metagenome TaxID=412755 RepID=A0A0F9VEB0_9ZZZZ|nr:chromosome segregation protein ScpA [Phycisphaerae bacterium]HDZ45200.1 chromosome segregation protein ScpA [Phycisphaerae bacterium]